MRGHDRIIAMRQKGFRPQAVYIWDTPVSIADPQWIEDFRFMEVCTAGDSIGSLDLRFLVGIPATVFGDNVSRVRQIAAGCKKAGAPMVVAQCGEKTALWATGDASWLTF